MVFNCDCKVTVFGICFILTPSQIYYLISKSKGLFVANNYDLSINMAFPYDHTLNNSTKMDKTIDLHG